MDTRWNARPPAYAQTLTDESGHIVSQRNLYSRRPGHDGRRTAIFGSISREYWIAGVWESREAYTSNSAPQQTARFERLRALLESDPEWHDGEIVVSN
jgi:hypothetical protein